MRKIIAPTALAALALISEGTIIKAADLGKPATLDQILSMKDAPATRPVSCHMIAGAGFAIARAKAVEDASALPFAASGAVGSIGAGCDLRMARVVVGGWAEHNFGTQTAKITDGSGSVDIDIGNRWAIGGRLGYYVQPTTILYGSLGYTQASAELGGVLDRKLSGVVMGAGLETKLTGPLWFRFSGDYSKFGKEAIEGAAKLDTTLITTKAALIWKF